MSSTIRSTDPAASRSLSTSNDPISTVQFPGRSPKKFVTFFCATAANSSRRSKLYKWPSVPMARKSEHDKAPEPTPASATTAPG